MVDDVVFPRSVVILGAGGFAEIVLWSLRGHPEVEEVIFLEDESDRTEAQLLGKTYFLKKDWDFSAEREKSRFSSDDAYLYFILGVAFPEQKKVFVDKAIKAGLMPSPTLVDPSAVISPDVLLGKGGYIAALTSIVPGCRLGDYVTVATNGSIGHHCDLGDFSFAAQGVAMHGYASIGEGVWLGGGVVVRDNVSVSSWVKVGSQSFVSKNLYEEGKIYLGVPAKLKISR